MTDCETVSHSSIHRDTGKERHVEIDNQSSPKVEYVIEARAKVCTMDKIGPKTEPCGTL